MRFIRARKDDWVPHNPNIRVGSWIVGMMIAAALYVATAIVIGHLINGNGAPFLT